MATPVGRTELGLCVQPKSRNCIGGEERLMVLAEEGRKWSGYPSSLFSRLRTCFGAFYWPKNRASISHTTEFLPDSHIAE